MNNTNDGRGASEGKGKNGYNRFLLLVAGLGGLLYGIDIGVIDPALPYLNRAIKLTEQQTSYIVAAVLGGIVARLCGCGAFGGLAGAKENDGGQRIDVCGKRGNYFHQPKLCAADAWPPVAGNERRRYSGRGALYLAESLGARNRGSGTAIFQFMLTFGIVLAAFVGRYFIGNAEAAIEAAGSNQSAILAASDHAWRGMFLTVMYPGIFFLLGSFIICESPRWLFRRGKLDAARAGLLKSRKPEEAEVEMKEMADSLAHERLKPQTTFAESMGEIFTQRKYVIPFILGASFLGVIRRRESIPSCSS